MNETDVSLWLWLLAGLGVVIIGALAYYAGRLLAQLKQQNQRRSDALNQRNINLLESITTIAKAMEQGQCPLSEGCLRLVVLLDLRTESLEAAYAKRYPHIHDMYERIKHMPTHEARKKYPKQDIRKMDKEREGYEEQLEDVILNDVRQLLKDFA